MARDPVKQVRNLRRLARSSNPHEAESAAARAQEIMRRHGLTEEQVGEASSDEVMEVADQKIDALRVEVARAVAFSRSCKLVGNGVAMGFRGAPDSVKSAREIYRALVDLGDAASQMSTAGDPPQAAREAWRICWWFGYAGAVTDRLAPRKQPQPGGGGGPAVATGTVAEAAQAMEALVAIIADQVNDAAAVIERLRQRAYAAGRFVGERVDVDEAPVQLKQLSGGR